MTRKSPRFAAAIALITVTASLASCRDVTAPAEDAGPPSPSIDLGWDDGAAKDARGSNSDADPTVDSDVAPPPDAQTADGPSPADMMPPDAMPADGMPPDVMPADVMPADVMPADAMPADLMPADVGSNVTCPPSGVLCSPKPLYSSRIGAWYTVWWVDDAAQGPGSHWVDWSRYKPLAGYYRSGHGAALKTQLSQWEQMRLDFLILDHTNGLGNDGGKIKVNADALTAALDKHPTIKQAVAFGGALWAGPQAPDLKMHQVEADLVWASYANPALHPSALLVGGKPLAVLYTAAGYGDSWTDPRFEIGAATGSTSQASAAMKQRGLYGWVIEEPTPLDKRVMGVMPGWDTAHLGRPTTPLPRQGGARFARQWLRAIKANPQRIVIVSWNDFAEETAIEPATAVSPNADAWRDAHGAACPAFYYELARAYSLLRWGLEIGAFVREENDPTVYRVEAGGLRYQTAMPSCHPVVFVPDGYLASFAVL